MPPGDWYCQFDDDVVEGPYSFEELVYLVCRKRLSRTDLVRQGEDKDWISAGQIKRLFPKDAPKQEEPSPDSTEPAEPEKSIPEVPETSGPLPPPVPDNDMPVRRIVAIGVAGLLLLLLLLLPFFFLYGDGGRGTAKGSGGNATGAGASSGGSGDQGDGSQTTNAEGGAHSQKSQGGKGAFASADRGAGKPEDSSGNPGQRDANQTSASSTSKDAKQAEKPKDAATQKRKPLPTAVNAIAYDVIKQSPTQKASDQQRQSNLGGTAGGSGKEGVFFGIKAKGHNFVYIVDCSGSMAGGPFALVCEELNRSIRGLTPKQSFFVFFFHNNAIPMFGKPSRKMLKATPKNIQDLEQWISTIRASGGTNPSDAISEALQMKPKPDAIFLLSDGQLQADIPGLLRVINQPPPSRRLNNTTPGQEVIVPVNTIGFQNTSGEFVLKQIANENRGEYRFISGFPHTVPSRVPGAGSFAVPKSVPIPVTPTSP